MTVPGQPQFAIRLSGPDGVERLYLATAVATFATGKTMPAGATAAMKASIARIEAILGDKAVAMIAAEGINLEGQVIEREMIEGQVIDNRDDD